MQRNSNKMATIWARKKASPSGEAAARRRLRESASPLPEVFLYYAAGWLSVSVESVSVLSLSAVDSDAMMSVTWLEPSRF